MELPPPPRDDPEAAARWVDAHLGDLIDDGPARPSPAFRGGQTAADAALEGWSVAGYAGARNEVWPPERRGASRLSPYVRHGLIDLPRLWDHVAGGPARDVRRFRGELLWQEYARHLYARLGGRLGRPLRAAPPAGDGDGREAWDRRMACMDLTVGELERDGWLVNQTRMWMASQWSVRHGLPWRDGERRFFAHLLDGSRAANALGWQWVAGTATGRRYGFARRQVLRRAPGLCDTCALRDDCPIARYPADAPARRLRAPELLRDDPRPEATAGPTAVDPAGWGDGPRRVWLTAESLGDADPALAAHPDLPAVFVWDAPMLARLRLSGKRLVFLAETLADLGARRDLTVLRGDPVELLRGEDVAVTFAPVPGFRRRAAAIRPAVVHPWPWLRRPHDGSVASFSAWVRRARA
ncbi:MAG: FAD-binding domain-containing protein [Thermoleophilia bacterium]